MLNHDTITFYLKKDSPVIPALDAHAERYAVSRSFVIKAVLTWILEYPESIASAIGKLKAQEQNVSKTA